VDKLLDFIARIIERTLALAFVAAVCLSFGNVIGRYGFGVTLIWADEVQIYIMIWMAFLGAVVASRRQMHLRMDLLVKMLPHGWRRAIQVIELLLSGVLAGVVVYLSGQYAYNMMRLNRLSDVAQIPMWIPHGGVTLGFALILVIVLHELWHAMSDGERAP
jgi:TRAP-type transport system small permease protein